MEKLMGLLGIIPCLCRTWGLGLGYMIIFVRLQGPRFHSAHDDLFWEDGSILHAMDKHVRSWVQTS